MKRPATRTRLCLGGLVVLLLWQLSLFRMNWPERYPLKASTGMSEQDKFVYFLYYQNLFPVASTLNGLNYYFYYTRAAVSSQPNTLDYSPEGARRVLAEGGRTLVMEWGHTLRSGQLLSAYLYLPDAWRLGSPQHAEVRITNGLFFIAALAVLYLTSWRVGLPVFGTVFVVLIGSNPFQLYEVYRHENSFSWAITSLCLMLALALPLLARARVGARYSIAAAVAAGALAATLNQIRPEPIMVLAGVVLAFVCATQLTWRVRILSVLVLLLTTFAGIRGWARFFEHKFVEAARVVAAAGGHVLPEPPATYHAFWVALWGGLGDFGADRGYAFSDSAAMTYAQPILAQRYGQELPWWWGVKGKEDGERPAADYLDAERTYYRIPFQTPHYEEVMREKVVGDILQHPVWFSGVIARRFFRLLAETTRPQIAVSATAAIPLPFSGFLVLPLALAGLVLKRWTELKILAFSCAISLPVLLVYSGHGMTNYSVYHLCALALLAAAATEQVKARA